MDERDKFSGEFPPGLPRRDEWRVGSEPSKHAGWADDSVRPAEWEALLDISALQADDALLNGLGGPDSGVAAALSDDALSSLLLAWRRETEIDPVPELIDVDGAVAVIAEARSASRWRHRKVLGPIAAAGFVLLIAFGGMSLAARGAHPGDALWPLSQVLYSNHARSVTAAASVRDDLNAVRSALAAGRIVDARAALARAQQTIGAVDGEDGKADLQATSEALLGQLNSIDPSGATTAPGSGLGNGTDNGTSSAAGGVPSAAATVATVPSNPADAVTVQPMPSSSDVPSSSPDTPSSPNHSGSGGGTSVQSAPITSETPTP